MNNIKLESNHNNINIFTNKNISLNTKTRTNNFNNIIDKSNSEKVFKNNNNILASNHSFDNTNQKLNFNFNFNFPSEECNNFLKKKRKANEEKKKKNFNLNLNLNVNLNTSDNQQFNGLNNNSFNSEPFNRCKYSDSLRSLKVNKPNPNQDINSKNTLINNHNKCNINFPSIHTEINPLSKKLKFINLKTRSSSDFLNEDFTKKYLGDKASENALLQKKSSFDFEKYSNNFQKQRSKRFIEFHAAVETRRNNELSQFDNEFKFNFDLLNVKIN